MPAAVACFRSMAGWWRLGLMVALAAVFGTSLYAAPTTSAGSSGVAAQAVAGDRPAVIGKRVIGRSVRGRPIRVWHLGERGKPKVLLISTMHGDEPHTRQILEALRDGRPIHGVDLWVLPTYNPDGRVRHTRKNAHGVDLNRNFPNNWVDLDGVYESGPRPASEPETRAVMRFLRDIRPKWILSFHQPLYGVDTVTKNKRFSRKVARALNLPRKSFTCGGACHGTMTGWYNNRFAGAALTAEYGPHPSRHRMQVTAPRQVLSIWGAFRHR
jgi:murein peptide amidase A